MKNPINIVIALILLFSGGILIVWLYDTFIKKRETDVVTLDEADKDVEIFGIKDPETKRKLSESADTIMLALGTWPVEHWYQRTRIDEDEETVVKEITKWPINFGEALEFYYAYHTSSKEFGVDARSLKADCYTYLNGEEYDKVKSYFE